VVFAAFFFFFSAKLKVTKCIFFMWGIRDLGCTVLQKKGRKL
jgi:hypothetical protein